MKYVIALDCGTTGNRAIVFDARLKVTASRYKEFKQYYPKPGWVEHDAEEILKSVRFVLKSVLKSVPAGQVASIGITNQRETVVVWDKKSGKPLAPAVVWQCRRTEDICSNLRKKKKEASIHRQTGLFLDAYFSATKIQWLMRAYPAVAKGLKNGSALCGTVDTWVSWNLSGGKSFITDPTNASRTMLFNIKTKRWSKSLCDLFEVPVHALPEVVPSSGIAGKTDKKFLGAEIPIASLVGDQQASAFAQGCFQKGIVKNTYGTGLFVVAETGKDCVLSNELVTTIAAGKGTVPSFALEGSIFIGGAAVQWLRDGLKLFKNAQATESMSRSLSGNDGVYLVPAFVGLGCPYWNAGARGVITGLTRGITSGHIARAALESMAYQTKDVVDAFSKKSSRPFKRLRVDGGAVKNSWLMQFQADILGMEVERPKVTETTALGAAGLAGIATGVWKNADEFLKHRKVDHIFKPRMKKNERDTLYAGWQQAVRKCLAD